MATRPRLRRRVRGRAVRDVQLRLGAAGRRGGRPAVGGRGGRAGSRLEAAADLHRARGRRGRGGRTSRTPEFAQRVDANHDSRADVVKAYAPYAIIIAVFVVCQISAVKKLLDKATVKFQWPGLDVVSPSGKPVTLTEFTLNLLTTPGTQMLIAGVLTAIVLKLSPAQGAEGVRNDAASAALGDPHCDGGAGAGVRDEPVRPDDHARHLDGRRRAERSPCCHRSSAGSALRSPVRTRRPTRCSARCRSPRRTRRACPMC